MPVLQKSNEKNKNTKNPLTSTTTTHDAAAAAAGTKGKNKIMSTHGRNIKNNNDGTMSWMVQLFQQTHNPTTKTIASISYRPQIQCLKLVNVLMETKDYTILSRLCEVPPSPYNYKKQQQQQQQKGGSNNSKGTATVSENYKKEQKKNVGLTYIALRYGIQNLLVQIEKGTDKKKSATDVVMTAVHDEGIKDRQKGAKEEKEINLYAQYVIRLLRNVIDILLPPSSNSSNVGGSEVGGGGDGFVIGHDVTVSSEYKEHVCISNPLSSHYTLLKLLIFLFLNIAQSFHFHIIG